MNVPKSKKNLIVLILLGVIGVVLLYFVSIRPMLSKDTPDQMPKENMVEELPTARTIDIMGKSIDNKVTNPESNQEDAVVESVFQDQQSKLADSEIPPEFDVNLSDNATDQERMVRILELQERFRNNNENFSVELARQQAEEEKAALQREANTYKELYEQSISDNNELVGRVQTAEEESKSLHQRQWLRVTAKRGEVVSTLGKGDPSKSAFYGGNTTSDDSGATLRNALKVTIQQTITVKDGDILPLRLTEDAYAGNIVLRAGTIVNGIVHLKGARLDVIVSSIEYRGRIMEVNLSVYDVDAQRGINVPQGDIAQAASEAVSALGDGVLQASTSSSQGFTVNQSAKDAVTGVVVRGAVAGIGSILKGKQRIPTVTIQSGYRLFLLNE